MCALFYRLLSSTLSSTSSAGFSTSRILPQRQRRSLYVGRYGTIYFMYIVGLQVHLFAHLFDMRACHVIRMIICALINNQFTQVKVLLWND